MWNSMTFPWRFVALLHGTRHVKWCSYHARTTVTVSSGGRDATVHDLKPYIQHLRQNRLRLNTCMDTNMQFTINSFRQLFPDKIVSLIFSKIPDICLTAVKFPDISRFSRQVVTLLLAPGGGGGGALTPLAMGLHLAVQYFMVSIPLLVKVVN